MPAASTKAKIARSETMGVMLQDIPPGHDWGWFSREDPRMHLQTVDKLHRRKKGLKVWLERRGRRVLEAEGEIPARVWKSLVAELTPDRVHIEAPWTSFMIENNWLRQGLKGSVITLTAYPNHPGSRFVRTIDLADYLSGIYDPDSTMRPKEVVKPEDVVLNAHLAAIEIWPKREQSRRYHISLPEILWQS